MATFGRGFYVLDDITPLRSLTPEVLAADATLFPVRRAPLYVESSPLGGAGASFQGGSFYTAANPPFGAAFTYYLKDEIRTRKTRREQAERAAGRRGEDVFYPPWDSLRVEDREDAPAIVLTVSDAEGHVVRRLTAQGGTTAGFHRVAWDLRYPAPNPVRIEPQAGGRGGGGGEAEAGFGRPPAGPLVLPGTYQVTLAKRVDGVTVSLGKWQRFEVYMLDPDATPRSPAVVAFQEQTARLQRAVLGANAVAGETTDRLQALARAVQETPNADDRLVTEVRSLQLRLRDLQESLAGDPTMSRRQEPAPPSLLQRINGIAGREWSNTLDAPTATQRRQYEIVAAEFGAILERLRTLVDLDLKKVEDRAEAAGAPWTSGRLPAWKP
jgi:hypothetical protein